MSVRISALLLGAALALTVTAAGAEEDQKSANFIMPGCRQFVDPKSSRDAAIQGMCLGVVWGIALMGGGTRLAIEGTPPNDNKALRNLLCLDIPETVPLSQMVRVVIAHIDARPVRMHEDFRWLALEALRTAWPCK
jgi:hypothetical protein